MLIRFRDPRVWPSKPNVSRSLKLQIPSPQPFPTLTTRWRHQATRISRPNLNWELKIFFSFMQTTASSKQAVPACVVRTHAAVNGWWKPASNNSLHLINSVCIPYCRKCGYPISCYLFPACFVSEAHVEVTHTSDLSLQWRLGAHHSW